MKTLFLVAAALLVLFALSLGRASAQTTPAAAAPPLTNFTKTVSPTTAVAGDVVRYVIQFTNPVSAAYTATVTISDTLDARLALNAASRTAQRGDGAPVGVFNDPPAGTEAVNWRAKLVPGDAITLTFDVTVTNGVMAAEVVTNVALLYAVATATPTLTGTLTATAPLLLQPSQLHLPIAARALAPFPTLGNSDFELGPGVDWLASPPTIIYAYADLYRIAPTFAPPGGDRTNRYLVWIGGVFNKTRILRQSVTIPRGYTSAGLRYQYWIGSEESACDQDTATLTISTDAGSAPLSYPILLCAERNTRLPGQADGWRDNQLDLSGLLMPVTGPAAGTTLTITFQGVFNARLTSNLWIENVVLCSDQRGAPVATPCTGAAGGR
jgi:fimbrial isopeptide formation D2 family protein